MPLDLNDAGEQREFGGTIPDGSFVRLKLKIRPGGESLESGDPAQDQLDAGLFTASKSSDALMLDCEFTVVGGPYDRWHIWENATIAGGSTDSSGNSKGFNIWKPRFAAMIDSACGLLPSDKSPVAVAQRQLVGFRELGEIEFWCKTAIQKGNAGYPDKATIGLIITPDMPVYAQLAAGKQIAAQPSAGAAAVRSDPVPVLVAPAPAARPARAWGAAPAPVVQQAPVVQSPLPLSADSSSPQNSANGSTAIADHAAPSAAPQGTGDDLTMPLSRSELAKAIADATDQPAPAPAAPTAPAPTGRTRWATRTA